MNEPADRKPIKTWSRASMIIPDFVGHTFKTSSTTARTSANHRLHVIRKHGRPPLGEFCADPHVCRTGAGPGPTLIQAAADLQLPTNASPNSKVPPPWLTAVNDYLRQAVVSDPDSRCVETSLRELDAVLGLRQKPRPDVRSGSLQQARIVSLDQESGMLVLNIGESHGARIGMSFRLSRGQQQPYGKPSSPMSARASAASLSNPSTSPAETPRPGDLAILETQATQRSNSSRPPPWKSKAPANTSVSRPRKRATSPVKSKVCRYRAPWISSPSPPRRPPTHRQDPQDRHRRRRKQLFARYRHPGHQGSRDRMRAHPAPLQAARQRLRRPDPPPLQPHLHHPHGIRPGEEKEGCRPQGRRQNPPPPPRNRRTAPAAADRHRSRHAPEENKD
jgi:hypothetical protein